MRPAAPPFTTKIPLTLQIHSLTARSVPRQFREGLKQGRPSITDRNIKVVANGSGISAAIPDQRPKSSSNTATPPTHDKADANITHNHQHHKKPTLTPSTSSSQTSRQANSGQKLNIVYDSENKSLVPYPDGEIIRTPSPEHSGIPARPVKMPLGRVKVGEEQEYTSDESNSAFTGHHHGPHGGGASRKYPPTRRRSKNGAGGGGGPTADTQRSRIP